MKIIIPNYKLPSRNTLYSSNNWRVRKRVADEVHQMISAYVPRKMITGLVDIEIIANYKHKRRRDSDNVESKLVIDSLKGKVIEDDDTRFVRNVTTRAIIGTEDKLIITISKAD
ncbi:MAG: RusA family crossover junction endodeoxyribonuclease [Candidatus Heimdallarchaeaceae archaeon]